MIRGETLIAALLISAQEDYLLINLERDGNPMKILV